MLLQRATPAQCGYPYATDGLCMSGTTVIGSIEWGTVVALYTCVPIVVCVTIALIMISVFRKNKNTT